MTDEEEADRRWGITISEDPFPRIYIGRMKMMRLARLLSEAPRVDVSEALENLFASVHHERSMSGDRFLDWCSGDNEEACGRLCAGFDLEGIALGREDDESARVDAESVSHFEFALDGVEEERVSIGDGVFKGVASGE